MKNNIFTLNSISSLKIEKFFCLCDEDGSIEWVDGNGESNTLEEDGDQLVEQDVWDFREGFCRICEKPLKPIMFKDISKKKRIEVYNMTNETRANWKKSLEIIDELEKENKE